MTYFTGANPDITTLTAIPGDIWDDSAGNIYIKSGSAAGPYGWVLIATYEVV